MDLGIIAENESVQLEDRSQEMQQPGDPQEEMGKLAGSRTDFPARMVLSEEEKLKISKDLVDLQIETNRMKERYETENFQLRTMMQTLERRVQELEQGRAGLREERDSLRERLHSLESSRQELGEEFIILKSNYLALGRELDKEVMRNEELTQELLSLAKGSNLPPGLVHQSSQGLGRGRAARQLRSARGGKPEDAAASEHEQQELERKLLGNQDHIKVELEKLKKRHDEQQQKLEERVLALGKELQEAKGAVPAEPSAVLLASQGRLQELEAENSRLQLQLKELNEEYRCRLARCLRDLANYTDSKPSSVTGPSKAPAGHAAMQNFVDSMLRDIQASYKCREEQLARAARGYRKRLKDLAKKHEDLLIAYGCRLQREQIRSLGSSAMGCGPAELHLASTDPELLTDSSRELNRLRGQKAKLEVQLQELHTSRALETGAPGFPQLQFSGAPVLPQVQFPGAPVIPHPQFPVFPQPQFPVFPQPQFPVLPQSPFPVFPQSPFPVFPQPPFPLPLAFAKTGLDSEAPELCDLCGAVQGLDLVSGHDPHELLCRRQLDEEGWAEIRRKLREFTLNTQEELEQQRSQLLTRAVVAEEQVLELQGYIDQHLAR
ncbi:coiled-coil domain-containing protein 78 [Serinus canaria]|uniref:coiled-coil domain-containing protein 78 n=1 Tax=Serinus canaria TaxID=9135 RepID=UPI0021CCBBA8|nr:coiled-coil domain-containing protein 78 [Serinus canaria]